MTEAVKAVLNIWWSFPRMKNEWRLHVDEPEYVYAACLTQNIAGQKLLEKCGFEKYSSEDTERKGTMTFRTGMVFPVTPTRPTGETIEKPASVEGIL
jgi:RimJ/RimL family protein N-acetyltransferase